MIDEILAALLLTHPADLQVVYRYVRWVAFRRHVHNLFYFQAHWITAPDIHYNWRAHWI